MQGVRRYDVVVVGAGPAGSMAARTCAEGGLSTLLIEEHGTIGLPVQCAGLLSIPAFEECRVSRRPVLHEVYGAVVQGPGDTRLSFQAETSRAVVVDRALLDREMAAAAADAGAEVQVRTACCGISGDRVFTRGAGAGQEIAFSLLIAADGPGSMIVRRLGFGRPRYILSGLQADLPYAEWDDRVVGLFPSASPEFFGWVIPTGHGHVRMGLAGTRDIRERFRQFTREHHASRVAISTGAIPLGPLLRTSGQRVMVVGDAAGLAKPTSGGGIYTGVRSAKHAAATAISCCEVGCYDDSSLATYERAWKADFGRELAIGLSLFRLRQRLGDAEIASLIDRLSAPGMQECILRTGDMDRPSRFVREIFKKPSVIPFFIRMGAGIVYLKLKEELFLLNE